MIYKTKDWYESDLEVETELQDIDYSNAVAQAQNCAELLSKLAIFEHNSTVSAYAQDAAELVKRLIHELTPNNNKL